MFTTIHAPQKIAWLRHTKYWNDKKQEKEEEEGVKKTNAREEKYMEVRV